MKKNIYITLTLLWIGVSFILGCTAVQKSPLQMHHMSHDEAIQTYLEYLTKNPNDLMVKNRLGYAYLKTGNPDQAIKEFNEVLISEPGNPYSVLYIGLAYLKKNEFSKATTVWQGYRNKNQPIVEQEISRLLTLLQIIESQHTAKRALAEEEKLQAVKPDPRTIAVCYYNDLSPDKTLQALEKGLAALVIADLSKIRALKVVERMRVHALLEEIKLGRTAIADQNNAPRIGRLLGAENLLVGNLALGSIRATTSLASTSEGKVKSVITSSVEQDKFYELSVSVVQGVVRSLGLELSPEENKAVSTPHTTSYKAFIFYSQALDALDAGDWKKARDLFDKALEHDPEFGMARKGRDSCPEIRFPGSLEKTENSQVVNQVETAVSNAISEQEKNNELISPGEPEIFEVPIKSETRPEPDVIRTHKKFSQDDDIREIRNEVREKPVEAPGFPKPPE
ncbi:MAG: tetratricopeptide repeat protein [Desulfobacteraceae bacterium]|nr:tetratricopeptide repeat protein [Desulfobacteraceae bacterium]